MIIKKVINKVFYWLYKKINFSVSCNYERFIKYGGRVGKDCEIYPDVEFGSEPYLIHIGNHVRITNGVRFITHDGGVWVLRNLGLENADVFGTIKIGDNVHIGWNVIIMPNVHIGNNCVIGACAVVTRDIPDNSVAVGVPARVIESIEEYMEKSKAKCDYTKEYSWVEKKDYLMQKFNLRDKK